LWLTAHINDVACTEIVKITMPVSFEGLLTTFYVFDIYTAYSSHFDDDNDALHKSMNCIVLHQSARHRRPPQLFVLDRQKVKHH